MIPQYLEDSINEKLTLDGPDDRVTAARERGAALDVAAFAAIGGVVSIPTTSLIPFTNGTTVVAPRTATANLVLTPDTAGSRAGCGASTRITGDGTHTVDLSAFKNLNGGEFDNGSGIVNLLIFYYDGVDYEVAITQPIEIAPPSSLIPLSTPTMNAPSGVSASAITVSWNNVANESSYELQRSTDNATWATINNPAVNVTSYTNTGLTASTLYYYRIKAVGDGITYSDSPYSTSVNATTSAAGYDADAIAYFTAASITATPTKDAVNTFILALKAGANTWASIKQIGLPLGTGLVNAKSPGTKNLSSPAAPTIGSTGYSFNGTTQYLNTNIISGVDLAAGSATVAMYVKSISADKILYGVADGGSSPTTSDYIAPLSDGNTFLFRLQSAGDLTHANATAPGAYVMSRRQLLGGTDIRATKDNTQYYTSQLVANDGAVSSTYPNYWGARNNEGDANLFGDPVMSCLIIGLGITNTQMQELTNAINDLVTTMGWE